MVQYEYRQETVWLEEINLANYLTHQAKQGWGLQEIFKASFEYGQRIRVTVLLKRPVQKEVA